MITSKPPSVRLFDCLFWLSQAVMLLELAVRSLALVKKILASTGSFEAHLLMLVPISFLIAFTLWYFASVRKSYIALFIIGILVVIKGIIFFVAFPLAAWSNATWVVFKFGPLLLLFLAIAVMMTPSARAWRTYDRRLLSEVFD